MPGPRPHPSSRSTGSVYDAFTLAGIPAGGIFAGAEEIKQQDQVALYGGTAGHPFDRCYHQLCDTLANINEQGLFKHKDLIKRHTVRALVAAENR